MKIIVDDITPFAVVRFKQIRVTVKELFQIETVRVVAVGGKSAYDYAVDGGYSGSQADFIADIARSADTAPAIVDSASGGVASFGDGADGYPVKNTTVTIKAAQAGSGEASSENIRPISGFTGLKLYRRNKNLWSNDYFGSHMTLITDPTDERYGYYRGYVARWANAIKASGNGLFGFPVNFGQITVSAIMRGHTTLFRWYFIFLYDDGTEVKIQVNTPAEDTRHSKTSDINKNCIGFYFDTVSGTSAYGGCIKDVQIELGATATEYVEPNNAGYTVDWSELAGTVYGGKLNVTTGELTVTHGYIDSYNGETLTGEWISDRDVYAEGTTPTAGAQVVYELETPTVYQLTAQTVTTLLGENGIFADTGDVIVAYKADTKLYIDKNIAELQALILENLNT